VPGIYPSGSRNNCAFRTFSPTFPYFDVTENKPGEPADDSSNAAQRSKFD
jgi:hypothetical protein